MPTSTLIHLQLTVIQQSSWAYSRPFQEGANPGEDSGKGDGGLPSVLSVVSPLFTEGRDGVAACCTGLSCIN